MKKILSTLLLLAVIGKSFLFAQAADSFGSTEEREYAAETETNTGFEIYGGYGLLTVNTYVALLLSVFGGLAEIIGDSMYNEITHDDKETDLDFKDSGAFNIGFNYHINKAIYAGVMGTYQHFTIVDSTDLDVFSALLNFGVQYGWEKIKFYNEIGGGLEFLKTSDSFQTIPGFNITWFGIKFRPAEHLWINLDSSFGTKGMFSAGLKYQF